MKHLKSYKIFESIDSIEIEVKDILSELEDSGHDLHTNLFDFKEYYRLDVFINFQPPIYTSEFRESVSHLISHLETEGWNSYKQWMFPIHLTMEMDLNYTDDKIKRIELRFDKSK